MQSLLMNELNDAIFNANFGRVQSFLEEGVNLNRPASNGLYPVEAGISSGNVEMLALLIKHGADVNIPMRNRSTPLHYAFDYIIDGMVQQHAGTPDPRMLQIIRLLLAKGALIDAKDEAGDTPLDALSLYAGTKAQFDEWKNCFRPLIHDIDERIIFRKKLPLFQIDAFTDKQFGGNPACVVQLTDWLPDELMLKIACENAVAETAFFIIGNDKIKLRWFTPEIEMDLCGHATLATAYAMKTMLRFPGSRLVFDTLSGDLVVTVNQDLYTLDFPARKPVPSPLPEIISTALSKQPQQVLRARDYVLVYETEQDIAGLTINRQVFDQINLHPGGVIVTAKGDHCDFVSRFFTPQASILEDPVTGSAHCSLVPFWSEQLRKKEMKALQLSERVGKLFCVDNGDRVLISGKARTYSIGTLWLELND